MFYLEWSSLNEQQAEVRNVAPVAQTSDYRPKTNLRALTYQVVCSGVKVAPYLTTLWPNITFSSQTHTRREGDVANEERGIKVRKAAAPRSKGSKMRQQRGMGKGK